MSDPQNLPPNSLSYKQAGADVDASDALVDAIAPAVKATRRPGTDALIGGLTGLFDLKAAGFVDPVLVAATAGVGAKLKVAIETGRHASIGIDLVAMSANDVVARGAEPLFFLDHFATGQLEVTTAAAVMKGIAEGCRMAGCALIGSETAQMPGLFHDRDYDLAGFAVGAAERGTLLPGPDLAPGDVLVALASSGVHSTGYALVRQVVDMSAMDWFMHAPWDKSASLAEALLTPTRIYVTPILSAQKAGLGIKALAHITEGGLLDNIARVLPATLAARIDLAAMTVPPVFKWLSHVGGLPEIEMLRIFNCGAGMIAAIAADRAESLVEHFNEFGEVATVIGELVERAGEPVEFGGRLGL